MAETDGAGAAAAAGSEQKQAGGQKRIGRPSNDAQKAKLAGVRKEIEELEAKMEVCKAKMAQSISESKGTSGEVKEARDTLNAIKTEHTRIKATRDALQEQRTKLREASTAARDKARAQASKTPRTRPEELQGKIEDLEDRQASGSLSLSEEKDVVRQIMELQAQLKAITNPSEGKRGENAGDKAKWTQVNDRLTAANAELKAVGERMRAQIEILKTFDESRNKHSTVIPALKEEMTNLRTEINAKYTLLRQMREQHDQHWQAFKDYQTELRKQREREEAERKPVDEARRRAAALAEIDRNPFEEELELCNSLITHLEGLRGPKETAASAAGEQESKSTAVAMPTGVRVLNRDAADDDFFSQVAKKKTGKAPKPKQVNRENQALPIGLDMIASYKKVQVALPTTYGDIDRALTDLAAKKAHFTSAPRPTGKIPVGADVSTPYGTAVLVERRKDGSLVVKMSNFFATAYLQADQVTLDLDGLRAAVSREAPLLAAAQAAAGSDRPFRRDRDRDNRDRS